MKTIKTLILGASILAIGTGALGITEAQAESSGTSEYVKNVKLDFPGYAAVVHIKNTSGNKNIENINLQVQESKLDFLIGGSVYCKKGSKTWSTQQIDFIQAAAYFGSVELNGSGQLNVASTLHSDSIDVGFYDQYNETVENTEDTFSVPLNKLKNVSPALRVDPLAELEKELQAYINNGGKAVDFYKQDHDLVLQRPLSLTGTCNKHGKNGGNKSGYRTKEHTVQIKYEGDAEIFETPVPKLNAMLQGNMQNQVNNILPFKLDKATFQPNMPHHIGKCIPDQNPKIRINLKASGSTGGTMDLRVVPGSTVYAYYGPYFETFGISRKAGLGTTHLDFRFPLKEMLSQDKYSYMAMSNNKTYNHNMRIQARYRAGQDGPWSAWTEYGNAVFKHRCTPQIAVGLGGNGKQMGYQGGNNPKPGLNIQPITPTPSPAKLGIKAPQKPKPARAKR